VTEAIRSIKWWGIAAAVLGWALLSSSPAAAEGPGLGLRIVGDRFVDEAGREVVLRGVNTGDRGKVPPFIPFELEPDFDTALNRYADAVAGMGFNVVRLLVIWEAVEPEPGRYDEEYLKHYDAMVSAFTRRGVRVIVDSHQDVISRRFCGDGFPDWALLDKDLSYERNSDCRAWNLHYFAPATLRNLDRFWTNADGLQDHYAAFFRMLAERYRGEPGVIGFEPMNEPMPGRRGLTHYKQWYGQLFGMYEKVGAQVAQVEPRYLIFADLCPLENQGSANSRRPRPKVNNLVLAPHYYDLGTFGVAFSRGGDQWFMRLGINKHLALARTWGVPAMLTEFGVAPHYHNAVGYANEFYGVLDEHRLSGTFWQAQMSPFVLNHENSSIFDSDGSLRPRAAALDRPYPRAVAGSSQTFSYDAGTGGFTLTWTEEVKAGAPTVVYLPPRVYGDHPRVELTPPGASSYDAARGELTIPAAVAGERRLVARP
jgi:endoglycosylceramidase